MNNVFDFSIVTNWIHQMLTSLMPEGLAIFLECCCLFLLEEQCLPRQVFLQASERHIFQ